MCVQKWLEQLWSTEEQSWLPVLQCHFDISDFPKHQRMEWWCLFSIICINHGPISLCPWLYSCPNFPTNTLDSNCPTDLAFLRLRQHTSNDLFSTFHLKCPHLRGAAYKMSVFHNPYISPNPPHMRYAVHFNEGDISFVSWFLPWIQGPCSPLHYTWSTHVSDLACPQQDHPCSEDPFSLFIWTEEAAKSCDCHFIPGHFEAMDKPCGFWRVMGVQCGGGMSVLTNISTDAMNFALWMHTASVAAAFKGPLISGWLITPRDSQAGGLQLHTVCVSHCTGCGFEKFSLESSPPSSELAQSGPYQHQEAPAPSSLWAGSWSLWVAPLSEESRGHADRKAAT